MNSLSWKYRENCTRASPQFDSGFVVVDEAKVVEVDEAAAVEALLDGDADEVDEVEAEVEVEVVAAGEADSSCSTSSRCR